MAVGFQDEVVWITGGGSGLGRAMALEFASRGCRVVVSGRRLERLEDTVAAATRAQGKVVALTCDVTNEQEQAEALQTIVKQFGRLDVVVANAGFSVDGRFANLTSAQWRKQFETNVFGLVMTVQQALPELSKTNGRIALISSVASMISYPGGSAYGSSKAAVRSIGLCLSQELHGTGVSCTTIHPGFVESEIAKVSNDGVFDADKSDPRPAKLMWASDHAARVMVRAIEKRKVEFIFTGHGHLFGFLGRHFPSLVHVLITRFIGRTR